VRAALREDPDVILVGEMRDLETMRAALTAAETGHLVFSTLHTNSAVSAVTRLRDIGAERFLIASTLVAVIAQRLVRRLCGQCKAARPAESQERERLNLAPGSRLYEPVGCPLCAGTGYRGSIGLFETLWIGERLAQLIGEGADEPALIRSAEDYQTLWDDGRAKVAAGITSLVELRRVVGKPLGVR
jgi:type II secretory ATPase GspE/PulE/Tfp pilus assembly ATPase PilB-like protein